MLSRIQSLIACFAFTGLLLSAFLLREGPEWMEIVIFAILMAILHALWDIEKALRALRR